MFTPGVSSSATEGRLYLVSGQALAVQDGQIPRGPAPAEAIFLGDLDGEPCFAASAPAELAVTSLRQLYSALPEEDFALAGRALGLVAWDRDHRHCGRCGSPTTRSTKERLRTCTSCGHGSYPRLSPAVIVLVEREGRALLARSPNFPVPFFSTLAGFVEIGETLEQTVAREIREEVGVEVDEIRYFGSQPWPFSGSLMVGFVAKWAGGEIVMDPTEIAEADWFSPQALPRVPPPLSIARALIDDFVRRNS